MAEIEQSKNVVTATNRPKLYDRLEAIQGQLTLCEKALAEYLETKRLAFPRFYFVSSADLLDILSNGNQPKIVMRHLTKLFDSMAKLKFKQDDSGNDIKVCTRILIFTIVVKATCTCTYESNTEVPVNVY